MCAPIKCLGMPSKKVFKAIVPIMSDTPLHSHIGTSTIGTFELGFGPPPTYQNLGRIDKNFGWISHDLPS